MRPYIAELGAHRRHLRQRLSQRRPAQRIRRVRREPGVHGRAARRVRRSGLVNIVGGCCGTTPEHIRAIAEAVAGDAARHAANAAAAAPVGPRGLHAHAGTPLRQCRRAHQRHRLGQVPQADHRRRLRQPRSRWRASRSRTARRSSTSTWTRACSTPKQAMTHLPQPDRRRAGHRPRADDDRLLQVDGDRGRPQVRAGQGHRQLDLAEGRRGGVSRTRAIVRRYGAAVVVMAFDEQGQADTLERKVRDLRARLRHPGRPGRLPARGHHLRSQHLRRRHRHRGAQQLRRRLHRGHARIKTNLPDAQDLRRRLQPLVLVPRQRRGARGDALGVPLPRHQGRHGHGHRQRRVAGRIDVLDAGQRSRVARRPVEIFFHERRCRRADGTQRGNARRARSENWDGKRACRLRPSTSQAAAGTSPAPAYTTKTEAQPFAGAADGAFQPATLKTPPSNWIERDCAVAVIPRKRMTAMPASLRFSKVR